MTGPRLIIGLTAVVVAVTEEAPFALITHGDAGELAELPFGPFDPAGDRTLELSLRRWVADQTGFELGYVEQLYTFGDRGREAPLPGADGPDRVISIGYLALTPERAALDQPGARWREWYQFFPWEDWRAGRPEVIDRVIAPRLRAWAERGDAPTRLPRVRLAFGLDGAGWNEERALDRYELLYEAGLVPEAARDRARFGHAPLEDTPPAEFGAAMASDHRRILATAISRLRAKIKYRPVVFELTPELFTLTQLQGVVEAISGLSLHKQNFRRLIDRAGILMGTGQTDASAGGRPAELFRVRRDALAQRPAGGVHVPTPRGEG